VNILATHPGRVKERLIEAAHKALVHVDANVFTRPGVYVDAPNYWRRVWDAITSAPKDPQRGVFEPSINNLTEEEATEIAQLILSLEAMMTP
jgi:hypothetical protein